VNRCEHHFDAKRNICLDPLPSAVEAARLLMLKPAHTKKAAPKKKLGEKKPRLRVVDITPRTDSQGGGSPKSSPVALPIPPEGFIVPDDPHSS